MKIVFFDVKNYEKSYFEKNLDSKNNEITFISDNLLKSCGLDKNILKAEILSTTAFSRLSAEVLDKFKNLKFKKDDKNIVPIISIAFSII